MIEDLAVIEPKTIEDIDKLVEDNLETFENYYEKELSNRISYELQDVAIVSLIAMINNYEFYKKFMLRYNPNTVINHDTWKEHFASYKK